MQDLQDTSAASIVNAIYKDYKEIKDKKLKPNWKSICELYRSAYRSDMLPSDFRRMVRRVRKKSLQRISTGSAFEKPIEHTFNNFYDLIYQIKNQDLDPDSYF